MSPTLTLVRCSPSSTAAMSSTATSSPQTSCAAPRSTSPRGPTQCPACHCAASAPVHRALRRTAAPPCRRRIVDGPNADHYVAEGSLKPTTRIKLIDFGIGRVLPPKKTRRVVCRGPSQPSLYANADANAETPPHPPSTPAHRPRCHVRSSSTWGASCYTRPESLCTQPESRRGMARILRWCD